MEKKLVLIFTLLLISCARQEATPAPTPEPVATATPTLSATPPPLATNLTMTATPAPSATATPGLRIEVLPEWDVGDTRTLELTQEGTADTGETITATTLVELVIAERNDKGHVLRWRNGHTEIEGAAADYDIVTGMSNLAERLVLEYQVNDRGQGIYPTGEELVIIASDPAIFDRGYTGTEIWATLFAVPQGALDPTSYMHSHPWEV